MEAYPRAAMERAMKVQDVLLQAMAKKITWWQAAEILGISDRHIRRTSAGLFGEQKTMCSAGRRCLASPRHRASIICSQMIGKPPVTWPGKPAMGPPPSTPPVKEYTSPIRQAAYEAEAAVRESLVGNMALAKQHAQAALALSNARDVEAISALALGLAGDSAQVTKLTNDLSKRFPENTIVQTEYLPMIRGALALQGGKPDKAIEALAATAPYELGSFTQLLNFALYLVYLRGEAYLAAHQGPPAAVELQKILDRPGVVQNEPIGALAHLALARAYALAGDNAKSRTAYQDFFALWKDADPDLPILTQAKAEYAKLQ